MTERIRSVLVSIVIVLAPAFICTFCSTSEVGGAVFLDHRQRTVALRPERLHSLGVESGAVHAFADRQRGDDLAIFGIHNRHGGRLMASREQDMVFLIERQAARTAARTL